MNSLPAQVLPSSFRVYPGRQRQWKEPGELSQMCSQPCSDSRHRSTPAAGERTEQLEHLYGLIQPDDDIVPFESQFLSRRPAERCDRPTHREAPPEVGKLSPSSTPPQLNLFGLGLQEILTQKTSLPHIYLLPFIVPLNFGLFRNTWKQT